MLKNIKSPTTTAGGITTLALVAAYIAQVLADGDPSTNPEWMLIMPMVVTSIALLFARDQKQHEKDKLTGE